MQEFEQAHATFIQHHLDTRAGERHRRLKVGHDHAEKLFLKVVWWPLFYSLDQLHPEYEVIDYRGATRYLDFAYIHPSYRIAIEIDGYGSHLRDTSRYQFADERKRHTFLVGMGWQVIRFAYDDLVENPEICRQLLQLVIGRYMRMTNAGRRLKSRDRDIIQYVMKRSTPVTPKEVADDLHISPRTARRGLQRLVLLCCLKPSDPSYERVRSYQLKESVPYDMLL